MRQRASAADVAEPCNSGAATRGQRAASVVGALMWALLMQLLGVLSGTESFRPYLLATQFEAWHGFLRVPADWASVIRALWVCVLYIAIPLVAAYLVFLRRDVAEE
jgi:ABC-2 type transport system permease protein